MALSRSQTTHLYSARKAAALLLGVAMAVIAALILVNSPKATAGAPAQRGAFQPALTSANSGVQMAPAALETPDTGYQDFSYGSAAGATSLEVQSKLWYNDGIWWAHMYTTSTARYEIYRLDWQTQTWTSTGSSGATDGCAGSRADTLWDGTHLYIASAPSPGSGCAFNVRVWRFTYNPTSHTYSRDTGFPVSVDQVNPAVRGVVIDEDSTGAVWITYTKPHDPNCIDNPSGLSCPRDVYVSHGTNSQNTTWVTPYQVGGSAGTNVTPADTISSIVRFGGNKMGVVWDFGNWNAFYFTFHTDGAPDNQWSTAVSISHKVDNHFNLKSLQADPNGKIYAVVKNDCNENGAGNDPECAATTATPTPTPQTPGATPTPDPNAPLIWLFTIDTTGVHSYTVSTAFDNQTRPSLVIDSQSRNLYVFATTGPPGIRRSGQTGINYKMTSMDNIQFPPGQGTPFIWSSTSTSINNGTTTKQDANSASGIVVLAGDDSTRLYFHNKIGGSPPTATPTATPGDPVIVGAGDIARCSDLSGAQDTASLINTILAANPLAKVFAGGDQAYDVSDPQLGATTYGYTHCYDPTWGSFKSRTIPAPGDHEYNIGPVGSPTPPSSPLPYYNYFGAAAGDPNTGYYSYDLTGTGGIATWHVVVLNTNNNCQSVGCGAGSPQEQWLRGDLAANMDKNVLAIMHQPRYSSGPHGHEMCGSQLCSDVLFKALYQALYDYGADLVLSGHDHDYERFAPQDANWNLDTQYGVRQFVVGTGGASHSGSAAQWPNSQVYQLGVYGVLKLTLHAASYDWQFIPVPGFSFTDSGSAPTHGAPGNPRTATPTSTPSGTRTATSTSTSIPTGTATNIPTFTPSSTATNIPTFTPTNTATGTPSGTATPPNTLTAVPSSTTTNVPSSTATSIPSSTASASPSTTPTGTVIVPTLTSTPTGTVATQVPTFTGTPTSPVITGTPSATATGQVGTPSETPTGPVPTASATGVPGTGTATATETVSATPSASATAPVGCTISFSDVPPGSPFYPFIQNLACRGFISGYADGTFRPNNNVTRGQISKIVANTAGFNEPVSGQHFEDVPPGSAFYDYVERMSQRGIISGYDCGGPGEPCVPPEYRPYFRPNNNATRGQISKIVVNTAVDALGWTLLNPATNTFQDVAVGSTFFQYIETAYAHQVLSGYDCGGPGEPCVPPENRGYFRPFNNATRGQSAKIVSNTFFPGPGR